MLKITSLLVFSLLGSLCNSSYANEPKDTVAAFHAAMSTGDLAKINALLAPDVTIYESGFVERSRAEYADHHLPADIAFSKNASRRVLQHGERRDGNLAIIWEETETNATIKGKPARYFGTETTVLQKTGENWNIVHLHWSSRKAK
jgi:ketosteroid isomerase-like protein